MLVTAKQRKEPTLNETQGIKQNKISNQQGGGEKNRELVNLNTAEIETRTPKWFKWFVQKERLQRFSAQRISYH